MRERSHAPCPACNGKGLRPTHDPDVAQVCPSCHGTGERPACQQVGGQPVPTRDPIRDAELAVIAAAEAWVESCRDVMIVTGEHLRRASNLDRAVDRLRAAREGR